MFDIENFNQFAAQLAACSQTTLDELKVQLRALAGESSKMSASRSAIYRSLRDSTQFAISSAHTFAKFHSSDVTGSLAKWSDRTKLLVAYELFNESKTAHREKNWPSGAREKFLVVSIFLHHSVRGNLISDTDFALLEDFILENEALL